MNEISDKDTNPKDIIGSNKIPLHLWPESASAFGCLGFLEGLLKYGRSNYREYGVKASIYVDACKRHLNAWFEGEDYNPDNGIPHLGNALACIAILVEAIVNNKLIDDRMYNGNWGKVIEIITPHVKQLKEKYKDFNPKHWTIEDNKNRKDNIIQIDIKSKTPDQILEELSNKITNPDIKNYFTEILKGEF